MIVEQSKQIVEEISKAFIGKTEIIEKELPDMLIVITSDFHIRRAKLLHDRIINYPHTLFLPAKSNLSEKELLSLIEHEQDAIKAIEENRFGNH